jgi:hypothetical protein
MVSPALVLGLPLLLPVLQLAPASGAQAAPGLQRPAAPPPHALAYVEASAGLQSPSMDGGRTELEWGDVNADGWPDLVCIGDHGSPNINTQQHGVMVRFGGPGAGSAAAPWPIVQTGNFGYGGVALGDCNGDGILDVGYAMHHDYSSNDLGDQLMEVALGDGTGLVWLPWDDGLATNGETYGMFGSDFADVDGDGDLDLGSTSFGCCAGVHVYRNHGDGTWTQSWGFTGGNTDQDFLFADFDGDGQLDVGAAHQNGTVYLNDGSGVFTAADGKLPINWRGLSAGDIDGDGRDELAFVNGTQLEVWSWGPGNVWTPRKAGLTAGWSWQRTELADMDGDGHRDLVAFGNGAFGIFRGDGAGSWQQVLALPSPGGGTKFGQALRASTDVDHNGLPDLSVVQDEGTANRLRVFVEASAPEVLAVRLLEPGPSRVWRGGQARFIDWTAAVPGTASGAELGSVSVELSTSGVLGPWTPLASGLPNSGRVQVIAPRGVSSADCRLRLKLTTAAGSAVTYGSGPFKLTP